jgi:hypothetical protein
MGGARKFLDGDLHRSALALAPLIEPLLQCGGQPLRLHAQTGFEPAIGHRQRIVKFRSVGEIAHGKSIQPLERAQPRFVANGNFHAQLTDKHRPVMVLEIVAAAHRQLCNTGKPLLRLFGPWPRLFT